MIGGLSDFSRGFDENYNNGFDLGNLSNNQINTTYHPEQVNPEYQKGLDNIINAKNKNGTKKYNEDVIKAISEGKNSGYKEIADFISNTPKIIPEYYDTKDKNKMNRVGEFAGSVSRIAKNPNVQGVIAGTLGTALTGNPLYGIGLGHKIARQKQVSDIYQDALKERGINVDTGIAGNLNNNDYSVLTRPQYYDDLGEYRDKLTELRLLEQVEKERHNSEMEEIAKFKAERSGTKNTGGKNNTKSNHKTKLTSKANTNNDIVKNAIGKNKVTMVGPDGSIKKVPEELVNYYQNKGAYLYA